VGNIRDFLPRDMTISAFWEYLKTALADSIVPVCLSADELEQVHALKKEKYDTWQWNFGSSPKFDTQIRKRFDGGLLQIHLTVRHGNIQDLVIFGDFLSLTPIDPLVAALKGCRYDRAAIENAICGIDLSSCLGTITKDELVSCILNEI
jgi:lipoate-protein ligase A